VYFMSKKLAALTWYAGFPSSERLATLKNENTSFTLSASCLPPRCFSDMPVDKPTEKLW
jgi:hypothetical protein